MQSSIPIDCPRCSKRVSLYATLSKKGKVSALDECRTYCGYCKLVLLLFHFEASRG